MWYSNPARGIQIVLWYSNSSHGIQILLVVDKFVLVVFKFLCRLRLIALESIVGNCCWFSKCIVVIFHCIFVIVFIVVNLSVIVLCVCAMWFLITLVTGLLSRGQSPEGPARGHLDAGFSWFSCVHEQMLIWYPRCQVATTCFSCSPPHLNLVVNPVYM